MKRKTLKIKRFLLLLSLICIVQIGFSQMQTLQNGDRYSYDGEYLDFRDSDGNQMIKMWLPPNTEVIKGVFISGHGGGGGDSRNFARDKNIRTMAMRLGFAVAGLHNFPGNAVYEKGAPVFFNALVEFAKISKRPEIANLPFVIYGSSNGGSTTYGFVNYAPQKAICFVSNVGAGGTPKVPVDGALKVPGVFIMGAFDALVRERGTNRVNEIMKYARERGGLWANAIELKGHEDGYSFDIYMKLVEQAIAARYPANASPLNGPVKLTEIKEEDGWLADNTSWDGGFTTIAPYKEYKQDKKAASWLLNKNMAFVFRSLSSHYNPFELEIKEFSRTFNPNVDPRTMFSLGGPVAEPGTPVTIEVLADEFKDWDYIEIYNGAELLGVVNNNGVHELKITLKPENMVYCLNAVSYAKTGVQKVSNPMHFFVKDMNLDWNRPTTKSPFTAAKTNAGSKNIAKKANDSTLKVNHTDSLLLAYALTPEMEKSISFSDNKVSDFWSLITEDKDQIQMTVRRNAADDATFNPVLTHDCAMTVKAAYGSDGLYFLFDIVDDNDVAWPNEYVNTQNEQFYLSYDAVDFIVDGRSLSEIIKAENAEKFISKSYGLTETTRQYQIACGTPKERPSGFKRSLGEPWDFNATYVSNEDAQKYYGLRYENIKTGYFTKAMELFIPWSEFGGVYSSEPEILTRFAISPGFNDRDEGEHFEPGVSSSGASVKAHNGLKWINRGNPWNTNKSPYNWGELILYERLE